MTTPAQRLVLQIEDVALGGDVSSILQHLPHPQQTRLAIRFCCPRWRSEADWKLPYHHLSLIAQHPEIFGGAP